MSDIPLLPRVLCVDGLIVMLIAAAIIAAKYLPDGVRWLRRRLTRR